MKNIPIIFLLLMLLFQSCEDCLVIELDDPVIFDCTELMLNIGEPCDDGNPDTVNDVVDANCICLGESQYDTCGNVYTSNIKVNNGGNISGWNFSKADQVDTEIGDFNVLIEKEHPLLQDDYFPSQFSAYDQENDIYLMTYQYNQGGYEEPGGNVTFWSDTDVNDMNYLVQEYFYSAPVFLKGNLYAIRIFVHGHYEVIQIDLASGQMTSIYDEKTSFPPQFDNAIVSSAADTDKDLLYFLCAEILIEVDPVSGTFSHEYLGFEYTEEYPVIYCGLEYHQESKDLLAIKGLAQHGGGLSELVSISSTDNYEPKRVLDLNMALGNENDGEINFEFYSTAMSNCSNKYVITELVELDVNPIETHLIEIDLDDYNLQENILKTENYYFGLEFRENK